MKLSNETLNVLKNFSTINEGLEFKQGKKIKTVSTSKALMAEANLTDDFPETFCVYDLNQFLSVNSLFKDKPELSFDNANITFQSGRNKIKYRKCADTMIVKAPDKDITLSSVDVSFTLSAEDYHLVMDTAKVLSSPHIAVQSDGENVEIVTFDAANDSAHENSVGIDTTTSNGKYKIVFNTENFKMIPGSYQVSISFKGVAHFKNTKDDIQYWVAFEAKHTKIG
jgi:hypothetical protein